MSCAPGFLSTGPDKSFNIILFFLYRSFCCLIFFIIEDVNYVLFTRWLWYYQKWSQFLISSAFERFSLSKWTTIKTFFEKKKHQEDQDIVLTKNPYTLQLSPRISSRTSCPQFNLFSSGIYNTIIYTKFNKYSPKIPW